MIESFNYLQSLLYIRLALFSEQTCEYSSVYELDEPNDKWLEGLVQHDPVTTEERILLLIALAPHLFPQALDVFLFENNGLNRPFTEFGGYRQAGHNGFLPTGETAAFVLAGTDPVKRLEAALLLDKSHWFYTEEILELVREHPQDPLLSGRLQLTEKFLNRVLEQGIELAKSAAGTSSLNAGEIWNISQAKTYPCADCSALCCRLLFLEAFPLQHFRDLDKVRYYLNFPNLEVMLSMNNEVKVYFSGFCGFLERETVKCKIHNQPEQPNLCVHYSPYKCFYKKADADKRQIVHGKLWLNGERLDALEQELQFNSQREITGIPSARELTRQLDGIPYTECHESRQVEGVGEPVQLQPPCSDCNGLCCSSLLFPGKQPETVQDLDFIRYSLGYPEVEYLVGRNDWVMKVNVRCKYLDTNNRCSIYEKSERPLHCRYHNPHKCMVKPTFRQYHADVRLEHFNRINEHIVVDNNGRIQNLPSLSSLKKILEASE